MTKIPKISIITPSFNQDKYIEETILSVINQDYANIEYIIIDGASTDKSVEIIKKYEKSIYFWVSEKDSGQSEAINKGFTRATGDIISWLNSDDILLPGALTKVADYFNNHKEVDIITGHLVLINQFSNIYSSYFTIAQKKSYAANGVYYTSQPSTFWRAEVLKKTGLLNEEFHFQMDKEFLIRVLINGFKFGHINKMLAGFRMHQTSKSSEVKTSNIRKRDIQAIFDLYGAGFGALNPNILFKLKYGLEKLFRGIYFRKFFFDQAWIGKNVSKLKPGESIYL